MAELEAGNSRTEACGVFSEVREGLAGGKSWVCALVPLGLEKPLLRPASAAEFSSSFWMGLRELLGRVHLLYYGTTGFALGNPLIDKEPPPAQPASRDANARHFIPSVPAHTDRHGQQVTDGRTNAPGLRIIRQIQQLEGDQKVVSQHRQDIERMVGDQVLSGRMVQIQPAEHFAKALFLGSLEPVPLKDGLRAARVCRFAHHIRIAPHQIPVVLPARHRKALRLLAFSGLVFDPRILLLPLVGWRQRAPLALGHVRRQPVQLVGPLVVADTPAGETGLLNAVDKLARAGTAVGVKVAGALLPARLMLVEQHPQVLAHVAGPVENPIQEPRPIPERLPAQCPMAFIVDACPFKLMALDFNFGVVKKHLRLPGVQPPARLCLLVGPGSLSPGVVESALLAGPSRCRSRRSCPGRSAWARDAPPLVRVKSNWATLATGENPAPVRLRGSNEGVW